MAWTVQEIELGSQRGLVLEADTEEELAALVSKATLKGWDFYVCGTVPSNGRYGTWLTKPLEIVQNNAKMEV
jgi:hypothetical protein